MSFSVCKLSGLLGVVFAVALLSACSESLETIADNVTKEVEKVTHAVTENRSESPERVVEKATKAVLEGRFEEAILTYGSKSSIEEVAKGAGIINREMARPFLECGTALLCTEGEMEAIMRQGGAPEEIVLEMKRNWYKREERKNELRRMIREKLSAQGGLVSLSTTLVSQTGDTAKIRCEIRFGNGETESEIATLVKESGEWKLDK